MVLKNISLQDFRSYQNSKFDFSKNTTFIVGPNTAGKTNLIESIYFLSNGKSFKAEKDFQAISFEKDLTKVRAVVEETELEVIIAKEGVGGKKIPFKKFLVNNVSKRRADFLGNFRSVIFSPVDLDIVVGSPSLRRNFLDEVLEQVDREYLLAVITYEKSLRQRNALLNKTRETGRRSEREFEYWDNILIKNGELVTKKREEFLEFINNKIKDVFDFTAVYDKSTISEERLKQYENAEVEAGVTLVGPHRDDFCVQIYPKEINPKTAEKTNIKFYGSRGQQRLAVLQLKLLQLEFIEKITQQRPALLLDDVFSELDSGHISLITEIIDKQQTIITTTHEEFIQKDILRTAQIIKLNFDHN